MFQRFLRAKDIPFLRDGEILKNEGEIPKRTQKRVIRGINVRWQDGRTFRRNRANSPKENETDNNKSSREESNNRGNEKRESNELGTSNELNKEPSRRNDNVRANLQLNLFEDTYVPPIKELPSVDTQINNIQAQAEVENTPAFSFTQEMIDKTLIEGSNFSHSKYRIYEQFKRSLSSKENIIFLKHEYALLIKGARRVGKSTIAEEFAKKSLNRIFSLTLLIQVRQLLIYLMICMIWIFSFCNCSS